MCDQQRTTGSATPPNRVPKLFGSGQAVARGQHIRPPASDCEAVAALAATGGQDGATRTGAHPQAEPVHLVTATVVRLISTLAHEYLHAVVGTCPPPGRTTQNAARRTRSWRTSNSARTGTACPREGPQDQARSWTCGTGRTGFDLPTVRAACSHGQFAGEQRP